MTATTDAPASLAALLREGSAQEHRDAEESTFVRDLLAGEVDAAGYLRFLSRLAVVYDAMESTAAELADDPIAAAVIDPALSGAPRSIRTSPTGRSGPEWNTPASTR